MKSWNFIEKTKKTWKVELTVWGRRFDEAKVQSGIFKRDTLSPLLFITAMMPLNHILREYTAGNKFSKRNEKELETLIHTVRIYSLDTGIEFVIEKFAMLVMKSGKRHLTDTGIEFGIEKFAMLVMESGKRHLTDGMELPNQDKIRTSEKRKRTNTWTPWKLELSNKWRWKKK